MNLWWFIRHTLAGTTDWSWYGTQTFSSGRRCKIALEPYLGRYGASRTAGYRYELRLIRGNGFSPFFGISELHSLFADAEYGFVLQSDAEGRMKPAALVTFDVAEDGGRPLTILHPLDLTIRSGQFLAVLGPSAISCHHSERKMRFELWKARFNACSVS